METSKKSLKITDLVIVFGLLNQAKANELNAKERYALAKLFCTIRKCLSDYETLEKETFKRLRPEVYDEVERILSLPERQEEFIQNGKYAEAMALRNEYFAAVNKCLEPEREKLIEVEFEKLPQGWSERLFASNPDWTIGHMASLVNLLED